MFVTTTDGVRLHVEQAGAGVPIVFIHEFGGNYWSWEPQIRFFSRRHRCIVYAARGYPPSDVPDDPAAYSQAHAVSDALAVLDGLGIERAHIVGLSMGGFATLHFGLTHPGRALSLVVAGAGSGSEPTVQAAFRSNSVDIAAKFESIGAATFGPAYAEGPTRVQYQNKDPRGWREFADRLGQHSSTGAAHTMRGVQAKRPSLWDLEEGLRALTLPTLLVVGDEDEPCLHANLFLKRTIATSGLAMLPKTGHTINLEEPCWFNALMAEFLAEVGAGTWRARDPRSLG